MRRTASCARARSGPASALDLAFRPDVLTRLAMGCRCLRSTLKAFPRKVKLDVRQVRPPPGGGVAIGPAAAIVRANFGPPTSIRLPGPAGLIYGVFNVHFAGLCP